MTVKLQPRQTPQTQTTVGTAVLSEEARFNPAVHERLARRVHARLIDVAAGMVARDSRGRDYDPVALIDDAFYRIFLNPKANPSTPGGGRRWASRQAFWDEFVITLRHLLVDHARAKLRAKRGGDRPHADPAGLDAHCVFDADPSLVLDTAAALDKLAAHNRVGHKVAVLHQCGGMSHAEVGQALGLTEWQARKTWEAARAFLRRELKAWRPAPARPEPDGRGATVPRD